jgi:hypothetical protein
VEREGREIEEEGGGKQGKGDLEKGVGRQLIRER